MHSLPCSPACTPPCSSSPIRHPDALAAAARAWRPRSGDHRVRPRAARRRPGRARSSSAGRPPAAARPRSAGCSTGSSTRSSTRCERRRCVGRDAARRRAGRGRAGAGAAGGGGAPARDAPGGARRPRPAGRRAGGARRRPGRRRLRRSRRRRPRGRRPGHVAAPARGRRERRRRHGHRHRAPSQRHRRRHDRPAHRRRRPAGARSRWRWSRHDVAGGGTVARWTCTARSRSSGRLPVLSLTGSGRPGDGADAARRCWCALVADHAGRPVAVDLDGVDALDDVGLGVLLGAAGRARQAGGDLVVVCASEHLRERFTLTGLDRAINVSPTLDGQRRPPPTCPHRARRRLGRGRVGRGVHGQHTRAVARRRGLHPLLVRRPGRRDRRLGSTPTSTTPWSCASIPTGSRAASSSRTSTAPASCSPTSTGRSRSTPWSRCAGFDRRR